MFIEVKLISGETILISTSRIYKVEPSEKGSFIFILPIQKDGPDDYLRSLIKKIEIVNSFAEMKIKLKSR